MTIAGIGAGSPSMAAMSATLDRLNGQYSGVQSQLSTGVVSDSYAGLGSSRYQALSLQPEITMIGGWQANITTAQTGLSVTQTALGRISSIAETLRTTLTTLQGDKSTGTVGAAANQARQALSELASLANTKNGDDYVFAGVHKDAAPIPDPADIMSSTLVSSIGAAVGRLGVDGADAVGQATLAAATDNAPSGSIFAGNLSVSSTMAATQARSTLIGPDKRVGIGIVLTEGGPATASSTGSPVRDLMRALATVAALPVSDTNSANYANLLQGTLQSVVSTRDALGQMQSAVGQQQTDLSDQSTVLSTTSDALLKQLASAKDSDPTVLAVQLADIKNQLTASYSLVADMKSLSLAAFI